mgnify:CR=1 FL=1
MRGPIKYLASTSWAHTLFWLLLASPLAHSQLPDAIAIPVCTANVIPTTDAIAMATFAAAAAAAPAVAAATTAAAAVPLNEAQDKRVNQMRGFILHKHTVYLFPVDV